MGVTLVTGGTGMVGSHVVRALLWRGDEVRVTLREHSRPDTLLGLQVHRSIAAVGPAVQSSTADETQAFRAVGVFAP